MRGVPPAELRALLELRLEEIHVRIAGSPAQADLHSPENSAAWHAQLEPAALVQAVAAQTQPATRAPSRWPLLLALALASLALGWFVVSRERWSARVESLRAQLVAHPGFVLSGIDSKPWRSLVVHGLLDPDAATLDSVLKDADLGDAKTALDLNGYLSSSDAILARRAARLLTPPEGVHLAVNDSVLTLAGKAPSAWIASAREHAGWIAGIGRVAFAVSPDTDPVALARAELEALLRGLPALRVPFAVGARPEPAAAAVVEEIARRVHRARELATAAQVDLVLTSIGMNDEGGSSEMNLHQRSARSHWLADALAARGIADVHGSDLPDADLASQRSAHLRGSIRVPSP
jgi:hypothetical protein